MANGGAREKETVTKNLGGMHVALVANDSLPDFNFNFFFLKNSRCFAHADWHLRFLTFFKCLMRQWRESHFFSSGQSDSALEQMICWHICFRSIRITTSTGFFSFLLARKLLTILIKPVSTGRDREVNFSKCQTDRNGCLHFFPSLTTLYVANAWMHDGCYGCERSVRSCCQSVFIFFFSVRFWIIQLKSVQRKRRNTISQPFDGNTLKPKETITVLTHKLRISCNPGEGETESLTLVGLVFFFFCFSHFLPVSFFVRDDNVYCEVHFSFPCTLIKCTK